jgi:hypothetical protein
MTTEDAVAVTKILEPRMSDLGGNPGKKVPIICLWGDEITDEELSEFKVDRQIVKKRIRGDRAKDVPGAPCWMCLIRDPL